jgi:pimeloyl-ACP methyl ester carboxylesterase
MWRWAKRIAGGVFALLVIAGSAGFVYQLIAERRDLAATRPPGQLVDIGGYRLHIWCAGSGQPAVLYDSGLGGDAFALTNAKAEIAAFTTVCTYDRAGMGYSDSGPMPRTSRQIATELALLLERSGVESPVVFAGSSFGGFNVRVLASDHTNRVAGLVLVDASHEDQGARYEAAGLPSQIPPYTGLVPVAASLGVLRLFGVTLGPSPDEMPPEVQDYVRATAFRTSRFRAMASELASTPESAAQVRETRRTLHLPVIVLSAGRGRPGVRGQINRELQGDLATLSTETCHVIARQSGHDIASDQPALVVTAIQTVVNASRNPGAGLDCDEVSSNWPR